MDSFVSPKDKIWFLRVCHYISNAVYAPIKLHGIISKETAILKLSALRS